MDRRSFLRTGAAGGAALALGPAVWRGALAAPAQPGPSPYGPLLGPDANGLRLPAGFSSRVVAISGQPVSGTAYVWHDWPDGAATFPTADGGWILAQNSELPVGGGVGALRFGPDGTVVDGYRILAGTSANCSGGRTPWGTWLSCEEWDGGQVWECDPTAPGQGVPRPALGSFSHEAVAVDTKRRRLYLTEDQPDSCLYRFIPDRWKSLDSGRLQVMILDGNRVSWADVPEPNPFALPYQDEWGGETETPTRRQVPGAATFDGGEGIWYRQGHVYFTTKGDSRVWDLDVVDQTLHVLYDGRAIGDDAPLDGVDNVIVSRAGDLYVAEDGGNMQICMLTAGGVVAPVLEMTGDAHYQPVPPISDESEVTGITFNPSGRRLYCSSQRWNGRGITYEVTGPFRR